MNNKVIRIFYDVDMRKQHTGLVEIAREKKVKIDEMMQGEHIIFINKNLNRVKMYSFNKVLSYIFREKGRIDLNVIAEIPRAFDHNGALDLNEALQNAIVKRLTKKGYTYKPKSKTIEKEARV